MAEVNNFLRLPRELRDEIYSYSLAAGSTAILATCKSVSEEGTAMLYRTMEFRIFINYPCAYDLGTGIYQSRKLMQNIQNIDVHWRLQEAERDYAYDFDGIDAFCWDSSISRKSCHIHIEHFSDRATMMGPRDFEALRNLAGFSRVALCMCHYRPMWSHPPLDVDLCERELIRLHYRERAWTPALGSVAEKRFSEQRLIALEHIEKDLTPALGPVGEKGSRFLVFHPRKNAALLRPDEAMPKTVYGF